MLVEFNYLSDASGRAGGIVARKNKSGNYLAAFKDPLNPQTTAQTTVRNRTTINSQAWGSLTDAERKSWENFANQHLVSNRLGRAKQIGGNAWYVSLNNNLALVGSAPINVAPGILKVTGLTSLSVAASTGPDLVEVTFTGAPVALGHTLVIEAALPVSPGKNNVNNLFRFIGTEIAGIPSPADMTAEYAARYGALIVDLRLSVRAYLINTTTGAASLKLKASTIIT